MSKECGDCPAAKSCASIEAQLARHIVSLVNRADRLEYQDEANRQLTLQVAETILSGDKTADEAAQLDPPAEDVAWLLSQWQCISGESASIEAVAQKTGRVRQMLETYGGRCFLGPNLLLEGCGMPKVWQAEQEMNRAFEEHMQLTISLASNNSTAQHQVGVVNDGRLASS